MDNQTENTITDDTPTETDSMSDNQIPVVEDDEQRDSDTTEIEALNARIAELQGEADANMQGWQRSRAEFTNYKRRTSQELLESKQRGALDALTKILPIMDDFERALDNVPEELEDHPWLNGTALILKNMQKVMDDYNIEILDPVGEEFDPNFHEAVGMDDSGEYESGTVTTTLQKGYKSGERVLRPALVRVAN